MIDKVEFSTARSVFGHELLPVTGALQRLNWLATRVPPQDLYLLQDGDFSAALFREAGECFVNGQFIAVVVLGFSFIERAIAGRLHHCGVKDAKRFSSEQLIEQALSRSWLTADEKENLNQLRRLRNPIVHFRDPLDSTRPEISAVLDAKTLPQALEARAKRVLEAAIHVASSTAI